MVAQICYTDRENSQKCLETTDVVHPTNLTQLRGKHKRSFHGQRIKIQSCVNSVRCLKFLNSLQFFPVSIHDHILPLPKRTFPDSDHHNHSDHPNLIPLFFWKALQTFCTEFFTASLFRTVRFFFFNFLFSIGIYLINNVTVSGAGRGAYLYIYTYPFSPKFPSHPGCSITLSRVPCAVI